MTEVNETIPRITEEHLDNLIRNVVFHDTPGTTLTLCVLELVNGFTVVGQSACVVKALYNKDLGQELALKDARSKMWQLEGYALAVKLYEAKDKGTTFIDRVKNERDELNAKALKLNAFILSDEFRDLQEVDQEDLIEQANHMSAYRNVLDKRIDRFNSKTVAE